MVAVATSDASVRTCAQFAPLGTPVAISTDASRIVFAAQVTTPNDLARRVAAAEPCATGESHAYDSCHHRLARPGAARRAHWHCRHLLHHRHSRVRPWRAR